MNKRLCFFLLFFVLGIFQFAKVYAGIEPFENFIKGKLKVGDSLWVKDEKFRNAAFNWAGITHLSVKNYIGLKINHDAPITQDFEVQVKLRIAYYASPSQVLPTLIDTAKLKVNYKQGVGAIYHLSDAYHFTGAHEIKVFVDGIESPQFGGQLPIEMQLTAGIVVDRRYTFQPYTPTAFSGTFISAPANGNGQAQMRGSLNNQVQLNVTVPVVVGADEYDLEWTPIDDPSEYSELIRTNWNVITEDDLVAIFKNNATRVTLKNQQQYTISLIYNCEWIAVRVRSVNYNAEGVRVEGVWSYREANNELAIWDKVNWHESNLNWQYAATFAEEGKKKEVLSYFDGTLRNRQTVTLLNEHVNVNDAVAVVQENIYDEFGRPVATVLPVPVKGAGNQSAYLKYFTGLHKNADGKGYNYGNLHLDDCAPTADAMALSAGAANYYSGNNAFLGQDRYKYLPNANGYPFSVNLYTADNTGRMAKKGGVGQIFQPGASTGDKSTKYYYGRPEQWELDAIFGNDVGYANRYQKQMVIDPNGQASITYTNASGKTIATALTGNAPQSLSALGGAANVKDQTIHLLKPADFRFEATALRLVATTTYVSSVIPSGNTILKYDISQLINNYPAGYNICSNCYYRLKVSVKDDCGVEKSIPNNNQIIIGSAIGNAQLTDLATGNIELNLDKIGTYFVTIELLFDETVIKEYAETFTTQSLSNGFLTKKETFIDAELKNLEQYFLSCFTGCDALTKLGTKEEFRTMLKQELNTLGAEPIDMGNRNTIYDKWIDGDSSTGQEGIYDRLQAAAALQVAGCKTPALSACGEKRKLLRDDVSPNGQYALFNANGEPLELETNMLYLHFREVFSGTPNPDDEITLDNGDKLSPYSNAFTVAHLVKYWRPEWGDRFVKYHPEYCKLQFCEINITSENWDAELRKKDSAPNGSTADVPLTGNTVFNASLTAADWLVEQDPFFKVGGIGRDYAPLMALSLREYSKRVLEINPLVTITKNGQSVLPSLKDLLQINLMQLYCAVENNTTNTSLNVDIWNNCSPSLDCREFDREWQLYRDGYLELKQRYIDEVRRLTSCKNTCVVGRPEEVRMAPVACNEKLTLNNTAVKIDRGNYTTFTQLDPVSGYRWYYNLVPGNAAQTPTIGLCDNNSTYTFYPCITIKYPGNPNGEQFNNVWKINCVIEEVECSTSLEFFANLRSTENSKIFYINVGYPQYPIWHRVAIYDAADVGSMPYPCNTYAEPPEFYRCVTVEYNSQIISYNNVYVDICPLGPGEEPFSTGGRMASKAKSTAPATATPLETILGLYLPIGATAQLPERIAQLVVEEGRTRLHADLLKKAIYRVLPADSVLGTPTALETFGDFKHKELVIFSPAPNCFVKLRNVWVAELLPDSGSIKYKEEEILQKIMAKAKAQKNTPALAQRSSGATPQALPIMLPCVTVSDDLLYWYYTNCKGENTPGTIVKRTTVVLLDQDGQTTTVDHDVVVSALYQEVPGVTGGMVFPPINFDIVIPAGEHSSYFEYTESQWVDDYNFSHCVENKFLFQCVTEVTGASFCEGTQGCEPDPGVICHARFANKISRFPVSAKQEIANYNEAQYKEKNELDIKEVVDNAAIGHASNWMNALAPAIRATPVNETLLRAKLTELTALAIAPDPQLRDAQNNPLFMSGLSSLPSPLKVMVNNVACSSYGDILKQIFQISHFTNEVNPWLLEGPVPYPTKVNGKFINKMQSIPITISNVNDEIIEKLNALKPYPNISVVDFYNHLKTTFGISMTLTQQELEALMKACGQCRYILGKDITLPVFLEPGTKGFITKAEYDLALAELNAYFAAAPNESWSNYEDIVGNFLNHKFGFALAYYQYKKFALDHANDPGAMLSNQPPYVEVEKEPYACAKSIIATAYYIADPRYQQYLAEEKRKFREAYLATCQLASANFNLETKQNIYHYTLYYYDQANNLIRTVPPEGVSILSEAEQVQAQKYREFGGGNSCNYNGPATARALDLALQQLSNTLQANSNQALEFWLYKAGGGDRQLLATTPDHKYMLQLCISGKQLNVDIYTLSQTDPNSISFTYSSHIKAQIGGLGALPWLHVVLQGNQLATGTLQLWVNGEQRSVQVDGAASGCGWTVGGNPLQFPENLTALKHLRHYDRLMEGQEILANAQSACLMPTGQYLAWDRFNVPEPGDPTTIANSTVETQYKEGVYPGHTLMTSYAYNSTNQVVRQQSPDAGESLFWYDELSRLAFSQNAKQVLTNDYSYTRYDVLGRIVEVGQLNNSAALGSSQYLSRAAIETHVTNGSRSQLTQTIYDERPLNNGSGSGNEGLLINLAQENLRKRVVASVYRDSPTATNINASYYNYDLAGNVKTLYQQIAGLGLKKLEYEYDLVSGKVNFLAYQDGQPDAFYYKYDYDAENRLKEAWSSISANRDAKGFGSSIEGVNKRLDASYQYYLHGPLARMELGEQAAKVQGLDYVYTLQGWLKGVNGQALVPATEVGGDGHGTSTVGKDAFAFSLGYYNGDYSAIGGTGATAFGRNYVATPVDRSGRYLYNGNIGNTIYDIAALSGGAKGYSYDYDQLNRLKSVFQHNLAGSTGEWYHSSNQANFREDFAYDGNGNLLGTRRHDQNGAVMDNLSYVYNRDLVTNKLLNNRLYGVDNAVNITGSVKATTYQYDAIGNLIADAQEGITNISWSVYGKIGQISKASGNLSYTYDATGNRVSKQYNGKTTYYVRDAQGNTLAVYDRQGSNALYWREQQLYGSSRLGLWKPDMELVGTNKGTDIWGSVGQKQYELGNHLGNVLAVISDKRVPVSGGGYEAEVLTANDYYAFGSVMPGRNVNLGDYRYGFNGKENDNEVKGEGNQQDYGMRIYDPRIGRFLSVDPITKQYPELTPYQFASNNPVTFIDLDGLEKAKPKGQEDYLIIFLNSIQDNINKQIGHIASYFEKKTTKQIDEDIQKVFNYALKNPDKAVEAVTKSIQDQAGQAVNDGLTLLYYAASGQHKKTAEFSGEMVAEYAPMLLFPEERGVQYLERAAPSYSSVFKGGAKGDLLTGKGILEGNHLPTMNGLAQAGLKVAYKEGSALQMILLEHRQFISTGSGAAAKAFRATEASLLKQGKYMEAFDMNAVSIRGQYGNKYDGALKEARDYYEKNIVPKLKEQQKGN